MPETVTAADLADYLSQEAGLNERLADRCVELVFSKIEETVAQGGVVELRGFGKFYLFLRHARKGYNPAAKTAMDIPASRLPKFKAGKTWKHMCNEQAG